MIFDVRLESQQMLGLRPNSRTAWDNKQFMTSCAQLYLPPPPLYLSNLDQRVCSNFLIIVSLAYFRFHYAATLGVQFPWSQFYAAECFLPSPCSAAGYLRKLTQFYFCLVLNTQAVLLHCVKWQRARSVQWLPPALMLLVPGGAVWKGGYSLPRSHGALRVWAIDREWLYTG